MDVGLKIRPELKDTLTMAVTEYQVLTKILEERKKILAELCTQTMRELGVEPTKYVLDINPQSDVWDLRAIPDTTVPEVKPIPSNGHESPEQLKEAVVSG